MTPLLFWLWVLTARICADLLLRKPSPTVRLSRGVEAAKGGVCRRELHPMSGENLYRAPNGRTACRECKRVSGRLRDRRAKGLTVRVSAQSLFEQSVARGDSPAKTCRDLHLTLGQYDVAMADWTELMES